MTPYCYNQIAFLYWFLINQRPIKFASFRWVEDKKGADRLIEIWHNIKNLVAHWEKLPKYKRPSSKSYAQVKAAVEDLITPAKLTFFSIVAEILQPILVKYQSDESMVPYIYQDLLKLLRKLMQLIVKPDIAANCSSAIDLTCIDLHDKNVIMKPKDMNIGFGTRNIIIELKRKDVITNTQTANFLLMLQIL